MELHISAFDTCFWHHSLHVLSTKGSSIVNVLAYGWVQLGGKASVMTLWRTALQESTNCGQVRRHRASDNLLNIGLLNDLSLGLRQTIAWTHCGRLTVSSPDKGLVNHTGFMSWQLCCLNQQHSVYMYQLLAKRKSNKLLVSTTLAPLVIMALRNIGK